MTKTVTNFRKKRLMLANDHMPEMQMQKSPITLTEKSRPQTQLGGAQQLQNMAFKRGQSRVGNQVQLPSLSQIKEGGNASRNKSN
jgi:hypothetical protein